MLMGVERVQKGRPCPDRMASASVLGSAEGHSPTVIPSSWRLIISKESRRFPSVISKIMSAWLAGYSGVTALRKMISAASERVAWDGGSAGPTLPSPETCPHP